MTHVGSRILDPHKGRRLYVKITYVLVVKEDPVLSRLNRVIMEQTLLPLPYHVIGYNLERRKKMKTGKFVFVVSHHEERNPMKYSLHLTKRSNRINRVFGTLFLLPK